MDNTGDKKEKVNHPDHYNADGYECIDVMLHVFGLEAVLNFCHLNAFKYYWRYKKKNGLEDIKKAQWYVNKEIELQEAADKTLISLKEQ